MHTTDTFLSQLLQHPPAGSAVASHLTLPPTFAAQQTYPAHFPTWLIQIAQQQGIVTLTDVQRQALDLLEGGYHVCLATPAYGGRGIVRLLAMYEALSAPKHGHGLFLFPSKHHALTQYQTLTAWNTLLPQEHHLNLALYDRDTPRTQRRIIKQALPHLLLTSPEMLHLGILPYHDTWRAFFQHIRYVVLVDVHLYHGALSAHLAYLLRRLQRITQHYGTHPQYLLTSLPLGHLQEVAQSLIAQPCRVLLGPAFQTHAHTQALLTSSRNTQFVCQELIQRYRDAGLTVLVLSAHAFEGDHIFSPSSLDTEEESSYAAMELRFLASDKTALVLPYHMVINRKPPTLFTHTIFLGLPSSLTFLHHFVSQVRLSPHSLSTLLVSGATTVERYLIRYPQLYHEPWLQEFFFFPHHPYVTQAHLQCAASELAWKMGERFPDIYDTNRFLQRLSSEKMLTYHPELQAWTSKQRWPQRHVSLNFYTPPFTVIDFLHNRSIAKVSSDKAFREFFEGALYRPEDDKVFLVKRLVRDKRCIFVNRSLEEFRFLKGIFTLSIENDYIERAVQKTSFRLTLGQCTVTETLRGYARFDPITAERQSLYVMPSQQRQYRTSAVTCDRFEPRDVPAEALHSFLHAILAVTPLWSCGHETSLLGYFSASFDQQYSRVVLLDACEGGNGASVALYRTIERVLRIALQSLLRCDCLETCSQCLSAHTCNACQEGIPLNRHTGITFLQRCLGEVAPSFSSVQETLHPLANSILYLTLSTQNDITEIGGWQQKHLLKLGVAVTYDTQERQYRLYTEETVSTLLEDLQAAQLVIGFNLYDFDYQVLQPYSTTPLAKLPSIAILDEIQRKLGFRLSLQHIVKETLKMERPDEYQHMLQWYRTGELERIAQQCQRDIELLRALIRYGSTHGNLFYRDQASIQQCFSVDWTFSEQHF